MIGYLRGRVKDLTAESALIVTEIGIGFEVFVSGSAHNIMTVNKECELYTYMQVREDGVSLFGFSTKEEKDLYLKLISVSGVGPKMGIAILSGLTVNDILSAIATSDSGRLSTVKGLGKKTAEKIILELRDKVSLKQSGGDFPVTAVPAAGSGDEDALAALVNLGFSRAESLRAIARAREQGAATVEDIIVLALRGM